jgi:excisionase family DNA binding protein
MSISEGFRPRVLSIQNGMEYLGGCSRAHLYHLLGTGKIRALKDGRKTLLIVESLDTYLDSLATAAPVDPKHKQSA